MRVLGLFSGIGAFEFGLERAGFRIAAMCEIDDFCRQILRKHWPDTPLYDDVRTLTAERLHADGIAAVDVICGGFPCQDVSTAGRRAGIDGARSGLWSEYARLIGELRPRYAIVENVPGLLSDGMGRVLGDLAQFGYDAEWSSIGAADVGAPHLRKRVWIVAHRQGDASCADADSDRSHRAPLHQQAVAAELRDQQIGDAEPLGGDVAYPNSDAWDIQDGAVEAGCAVVAPVARGAASGSGGAASRADVADADPVRELQSARRIGDLGRRPGDGSGDAPDAHIFPAVWAAIARGECRHWQSEPGVGRAADGLAAGLDGIAAWERGAPRTVAPGECRDRASRIAALGNAVVPQIVELIGRAVR